MTDFSDYDAALREFHERGIWAVDIIESELAGVTLTERAARARASGMGIASFVATTDFITAKGETLNENIAKVKAYIDECSALGIDKIMLAPMVKVADSAEEFAAMREMMVAGYGAMSEYAEGSGVTVTIENQSVPQRADSYIDDCKYIIDRCPKLGFVLDAGNFYCVGDDVLRAYDVFRDRIVHVHIKDWEHYPYGRIIRQNLPPIRSSEMGHGVVPLDTLLSRLKADGYEGSLLLEINGRPFDKALVIHDTEYLLSFCN
jgi:inosose dehydratase